MATRSRRSRPVRQKLSTTVARENFDFLQQLARRQATSLAEAVDRVVEVARRAENRALLATQTADYFARLSAEAAEEENQLGAILTAASREIDVDRG